MKRTGPGLALLALLLTVGSPLSAQGLRSQVSELFRFGDCGEPLCLQVPPGSRHGDHYIPSAVQGNSAVITFLADAIGSGVAGVPISSASGGATFEFKDGAPVRTTVSAGPIYGDRAPTLGRRRLLVGGNFTGQRYQSLRGVSTNNLVFNFTHVDVGEPGLGSPHFENDFIQVHTSLDVNMVAATAFLTYGVTDRIDVGLAVPFVRATLKGRSSAQVLTFPSLGPDPVPPTEHHFANETFREVSMDETAAGVGDVALRAKVNLSPDGASTGFAVLADVRLPTGDEEELLGTGAVSVRALGIVSARRGDFSPHLNGGFLYRGGDVGHAVLLNAGFDQLMTPRATLAFDLLAEWQVGDGAVNIPRPVRMGGRVDRMLELTNLPDERDHLLNAALGAKLELTPGMTLVVNGMVPLNDGGLRPGVALAAGLERSF